MKRFALVLLLLCAAALGDDADWVSRNGLFVVRYKAEIEPLTINTLHAWRLHLENAAGEAVPGASIQVSGGMPLHNHGLPTEPRITTELGGGDYRLDGLRFHMAGPWEITLSITAGSSTDTVVIALIL
ncbi:MAG: FixH family protein [Gammaproteobacteria bacterium]|nr:FixH family protein [Gammaproteobacteria bacterium]MDH5303923.1 FixH family protein [Gammaproteobacteria bacterium]MDH5321782.1 FixH family protein [Gammaproteobacteria bacterium]